MRRPTVRRLTLKARMALQMMSSGTAYRWRDIPPHRQQLALDSADCAGLRGDARLLRGIDHGPNDIGPGLDGRSNRRSRGTDSVDGILGVPHRRDGWIRRVDNRYLDARDTRDCADVIARR
jgi:hypothetical protein